MSDFYFKKKILSEDKKFPFGDSIESFFKKYKVNKSIGSYLFYPSPGLESDKEDETNILELKKIKYDTDIVFWSFADSLIDQTGFYDFYDFYKDKKRSDVFLKMLEICKENPHVNFIFFPSFYNLSSWEKDSSNVYICKNVINTDFVKKTKKRYKRCDKKSFNKEKNWVCLANLARPHRIALYGYLIEKNIHKQGMISNNKEITYYTMSHLKEEQFNKESIKILKKHFPYDYRYFIEGVKKIPKEKDFLWLDVYLEENKEDKEKKEINLINYEKNIYNIYKDTIFEIIPSTLFFESTPLLGEKEIQSIYGMNIPIFISTYKSVSFIKDVWEIDIFDDIIDHSYDNIEDPGKRLRTAIDSNEKLFYMSSKESKKLWEKVKHRLEKNCDILDNILYDVNFRRKKDFMEIKKSLEYFNIKFEKRK